MSSRIRLAFRTLGATNVLLAVIGLWELSSLIFTGLPHLDDARHLATAFMVSAVVNFFCLTALILAGVLIWRDDSRGIRLAKATYIAELSLILVGLFVPAFPSLSDVVRQNVAIGIALANLAFLPQVAIVYPLLALIALILLDRKQRRSIESQHTNAPSLGALI